MLELTDEQIEEMEYIENSERWQVYKKAKEAFAIFEERHLSKNLTVMKKARRAARDLRKILKGYHLASLNEEKQIRLDKELKKDKANKNK